MSECTLSGYPARTPPPLIKASSGETQAGRHSERDAQTFPIHDELKSYNTLLFTREHSLCSSNVMA